VSRVASMIGHLIGTPLQVIHGRAGLIRAKPNSADNAEHARRIEEQVDRLSQRIRRLIDFLTTTELDANPRVMSELLNEALGLYEPIAAQLGIALVSRPELEGAKVEGSSALIVLTNLLSLALKACKSGDRLELRASQRAPDRNQPESRGRIVIELDVPGLPPPRARIDMLDPPDNDSGADAERIQVLSVCFDMTRRQSGSFQVTPRDEGGSTIRLEYPAT